MGKKSTTAIDEDKETEYSGDGRVAKGVRRSGQRRRRRRRRGEEAAVLHGGENDGEVVGGVGGERWGPRGELAIGKISRDRCEVDIG